MVLSACIPPPRTADLSPPSFRDQPPIALDVAEIVVRTTYQPQGTGHVEQEFPTAPARGVELWAQERLKAVGGDGVLEVLIEDAGVIETAIPATPGIKGAVTRESSARYDARLAVELRLFKGDQSISKAHVNAHTALRREILEKSSVIEEQELFAAMTRELVRTLDKSLTHGMQEYFGNYLRGY
jgi:hypothetical protein